jgi:histone deacetylase 6
MRVTPAAYAQFIWSLSGLAGGRLVVMLEGGYCLDSLAESAALTLRTLLGKDFAHLFSDGEPALDGFGCFPGPRIGVSD